MFPNVEDGVVPLGRVVTTLAPKAERKSNFFHLFYKPIDEVNDDSMGADFYDIKSLKKEKLSKILLLELKKLGYIIN